MADTVYWSDANGARINREEAMKRFDDFAIAVTAEWNDWHCASARFADLRDVHWLQPKGAPHALIHAYASCGHITNGHLPHQCDGSPAHQVRVCVLKVHNLPDVYAELVKKADARGAAPHLPSPGAAMRVRPLPAGW